MVSLAYSDGEQRTNAPAYSALTNDGMAERMGRLLRYEGLLERSFFRVLHELERIQARRKGEAVIPPVVADVSIHGGLVGE